ncbi:MAG: regulatory protein RecX [Victivallales bacterium]|nr:regulatory protein RecX [Victivallales bacterium]
MAENRNAMNMAVKLLAVRAHSSAELRDKLLRKGFAEAEVELALSECLRLKFLDDRLFATMYLEELQCRGYGRRRCRMSMQRKGLPGELVTELLDAVSSEDETARAEALLERKLTSLAREKDPRKKKEKAVRFMMSRGFSPGMVITLYERLTRTP